MSNLTGTIEKRYIIIDTIGHGGMTTVYKAYDLRREQDVAVKVLAPYLVMDPVFKARFEREIRVLKGFNHPHIVPIIDHGVHDGSPYLVMPYFPEGTLADRLRLGGISLQECGIIIEDISQALAYEHERGVIHRDIKPSNILLDKDGRAYLADFDLVYIQNASQNLTGSAIIGTPAYMSPEQCSSGSVDARSDQYSLAIVLYQLTTGYLPFYADTPIAIALQQINVSLPSPRGFNPNLPLPIENVLLKALSKDPAKRYPSILAFNQAFQKALRISLLSYEADGSWTAKYYEVTQVLNKFQTKAKGWFVQSILTKRYALIAILFLLILFPIVVFSILRFARNISDRDVQATISAINTGVFQQGNPPLESGFLETAVAGTLDALSITGTQFVSSSLPIPFTGNKDSTQSSDKITETATGTLRTKENPEGKLTPSSTLDNDLTPTATQRSSLTKLPPPVVTWTVTSTPSVGSTPTNTPTASVTASPTSTPSPSSTSSPTATPTASPTITLTPVPTENQCANISLSGFVIKAKVVTNILINNRDNAIVINRIDFNWPIMNQLLEQIQVGSTTVWNSGDDQPPTQVDQIGITVGSHSDSVLLFVFKRAAEPSGYSLIVTLSNGCSVSISN